MDVSLALACRSHFSIGESLLTPTEIVEEAKQLGYTSAALVDTMTVSGMIEFTNAAKKAGIKPVIGVRLRIVDDPTAKKLTKVERYTGKKLNNKPWFPKLYILNDDGLRRVMRLLTRSFAEDRFYNEPRLGFDDLLAELKSEALAFSTGDLLSALERDDCAAILKQISDRLHPSKTFVELCAIDTPLYDSLNMRAMELSAKGYPLLMTAPVLFKTVEDCDTLEVLSAISRNIKITDRRHSKPYFRRFVMASKRDVLERMLLCALPRMKTRVKDPDGFSVTATEAFKLGMQHTRALADMVRFEWSKQPISLPKLSEDEFASLVLRCVAGWKTRFEREVFAHKPSAEELETVYKPRLKYEMETLNKMGFSGYFLVVQDLVRWAKENGIAVGPGRGSVGGSLIAYLLGITDVDPIRFNLLFERFINPDRVDLPDADLDFMSTRRHEVIQYLVDKYGEEKVAGIANYSTLASASALRDVARVYGIDMHEMTFTKLVPKEHGKSLDLETAAETVPEIAKFKAAHPEIWKHAVRLEGVMRGYARHAAGVVVGGVPLVERAVIERRGGDPVVNWDKRIVEDTGLVKMDILGLSTLDVLTLACDMIWSRHGERVDLLELPLDDAKVLSAFSKGETTGVFQFESGGMRKLLKDLGRYGGLTFEDLAAATALYRPGPMDSGMLEEYVSIKQGVGSPVYEHPNMRAALEPTYGVIVYQEQVMRIASDLAGFSLADADKLRKAMGKKLPEEMAKYRGQFVGGCELHSGMPPRQAEVLFDKIEKFAGYGFNRSHAVEYSLISYQSMWLKVHYPTEFYAAAMTVLGEDKLEGLVRDAMEKGITIRTPDINLSTDRFEPVTDTCLVIPFQRLKGISDNTTQAILAAREKVGGRFDSKDRFIELVDRRRCNKKHQEILDRVGAFASIEIGTPAATDESRLKDQMELLPGLIVTPVKVDRKIDLDTFTKARLGEVVMEWRTCKACSLKGACHPRPFLGKRTRFMVVTDGPSWSEEAEDQIARGTSFAYMSEALTTAGLSRTDGYFTTLVKAPKPEGERFFPNDALTTCPEFLKREIEILKPPVIVALGSATARWFIKDLKGNILEHAGRTIYLSELDATVVVGITPGMVSFDPTKQATLNDVFKQVAELVK